jgi:serine/threonine protein kinase
VSETDFALGSEDPWETTVLRDLALGRRVGDYVIQKRIGSGGMGIVYEAEHPQIHRRVAIKFLRPDAGAQDLLREARAASSIRHRHIIDVFGFGEVPGLGQYLVMDFLEGAPLDDEIRARAPMTAAEVLPILDDTAAALSAAHAMGIVHRDLKPGNLFLVRESNGTRYVKVLDFGLAKETSAAQTDGPSQTVSGTPDYMAPEQARAKSVDGRTDLYALGVIAFEMLSGRVPFTGRTPFEVVTAHVTQPPPPLRSFEPSVPQPFEQLVLRLMAKNPDERPASADALRTELKALRHALALDQTVVTDLPLPAPRATDVASHGLDPLPPRASSPSLPKPAPRPGREGVTLQDVKAPGPRWAVPAGLSAVALVAVTVVVLWPKNEASVVVPPPPPPVAPAPVEPPVVAAAPPDPSTQPSPVPAPPAAGFQRPRARLEPKARLAPALLKIVPHNCTVQVLVDGRPMGSVPGPAFTLPAGEHRVKLSNPHCKPPVIERTVMLRSGDTASLDLNFEDLQ